MAPILTPITEQPEKNQNVFQSKLASFYFSLQTITAISHRMIELNTVIMTIYNYKV